MTLSFISLPLSMAAGPVIGGFLSRPFSQWSLDEAVGLLNDSPWARQSTFTRVIGGVGSGVSGEKEIFSTFYTRLLSARPVREAFARVQQIHHGYDELTDEERDEFDALIAPGLDLDVSDWIIVAVAFRSNNPGEETRVSRFFRTQSVETLRNSAFLSTERFPQIELEAYFPPLGDGVGAKFVFPRGVNGSSIVTPEDRSVIFELDAPVADPQLAVTFTVEDLVVEGGLVL